MNSSKHEIRATDGFKSIIAKCLADAVGDDIKVNSLGLITQNGTPSRIWDLIYTNLHKQFDESDVIADKTKRGAWQLVLVFERSTGTIYSLMREKRFTELKKELPSRRIPHYEDALARVVNGSSNPPLGQLSLFPNNCKTCFNKNHIKKIVDKILSVLSIPNKLVKQHAIILFQSTDYELSSLRCCIIDSNLEIVNEANWSNYIKASESIVPDIVHDKTSTYIDPTAGLKYKQKAKDKMKQRALVKGKNEENNERKIADNEFHDNE